jgi:hypothetical protein
MAALKNLEVLKYCPEYYDIINEEILDGDTLSIKVIQVFQEYIFSIDVNNEKQIKLLNKLTEAIKRYFEDGDFKKEISNLMATLRIKIGIPNVFEFISEKMVETYDKYCEFYTRNLYVPRWV